jgi:transposase InsO family protein
MAYTKNPHLPKVRQQAADLVRRGWSTRRVARHLGYSQAAIVIWSRKAKKYGYHPIPTLSSRPKHHPKELTGDLVWRIFHKRLERKKCAEVIHQELLNEGVHTSISSVKRTLDRTGLLRKRNHLKRYHAPISRPEVKFPGDLVQVDTIHLPVGSGRIYVFTLLDVYSRWAYAKAMGRINTRKAVLFVKEAQRLAPFHFQMLQSDHGPEFSQNFTERVGMVHRHSRVRRPNDNAHLERWNRTLQEECLDGIPRTVSELNKAIREYLPYYNERRPHLGINLKSPAQLLQK